ncbi:MAG: LCP family protein [Candidatus Saccharibacteria bacterium]|nr:LCP family protein [Candidatus Saccharibacteria bacterium]
MTGRRWVISLSSLLTIVMVIGAILGCVITYKGNKFIASIANPQATVERFSVIASINSRWRSVEEIKRRPLYFMTNERARADEVRRLVDGSNLIAIASYSELASLLRRDATSVVILNEAYRTAIEASDPTFSQDTRVLKIFEFTSQSRQAVFHPGKPFNLYVSGSDTKGPLAAASRSDVNIIISVNPVARRIHITTIPRDSYVAIAGGGRGQKDKLTHASIYGIDSSQATLEQLLETRIDAYVRINFTSFTKVIDYIGGVTVHNPVAFRAYDGRMFAEGDITLTGAEALSFARERKSLEGGDIDRGKNQLRIVEAVIHKLLTRQSLAVDDALQTLGKSLQTNMSEATLHQLIGDQIGKQWTVTSSSLRGRGQTGGLPSYAMPGYQLYMYVLDERSVQEARARIRQLLQ